MNAAAAPATDTSLELKDPVCGMTVTAQSPHVLEHEGKPVYFCSAGCKAKFAADPAKYANPARSGAPAPHADGWPGHDLHLSDASGDPPGPSGHLPEVRHGARARDAEPRRGRESRAASTSGAASGGRCR